MHKCRTSITRKLWDSAPMGRDVSYCHMLPRQMWSFCFKVCRREAQKLGNAGALWWVRGLPLKICHFPTCYPAKFVVPGQMVPALRRFAQKWPSCHAYQGHSRSSEPNKSIGYHNFLLTFQSNHGPVLYCFGDKWRFLSKIANVPTTRAFNTPLIGSLGIG